MADREPSAGGLASGLIRAAGSLVGVHLQHAQREASGDLGRVVTGVALIGAAAVFLVLAVVIGHVAAVYALQKLTVLDWLRSALAVAGGDLLIALVLLVRGRSLLRRPLLKETRQLVKRTVESLTQS
ncbi:MAG: phage holin family protein [Deltaproteobacteria bacterium]|nr:phage holin family protein [Deltaproteobacteria bacterium]MBW2537259.1 phage holin family protein [Deltaproteobacteria bacterium]